MPSYDYKCSACEHQFTHYQSIHAQPLKKCPKCKKNKLNRVIYPPAAIIGDPTTVGGLADRNAKKLQRRKNLGIIE